MQRRVKFLAYAPTGESVQLLSAITPAQQQQQGEDAPASQPAQPAAAAAAAPAAPAAPAGEEEPPPPEPFGARSLLPLYLVRKGAFMPS